MNRKSEKMWEILKEKGCVEGVLSERNDIGSPWYVKALLAFSGWLSAIFMIGFLSFSFDFIFEYNLVTCGVGLVLIGGAFVLIRFSANDFVDHLGLAASLAGQALAIYGFYEITGQYAMMIWLIVALLQCVLAAVMPNEVHRVISSLVAAIALSMAFSNVGILHVVSAVIMLGASFCWLNEFRYPRRMTQIRSIGYGLILALVALECLTLFGTGALGNEFIHSIPGFWSHPWLGESLMGAIAAYVVWTLLKRYGQPIHGRLSILALSSTILLCFISVHVQGLLVGMFILCLGFYGANRILLGLGIVALIVYIASYYYLLDATLLEKSLSLLVTGIFLLCVRWLADRIIPMQREVHHG